MVPAGGRVRGAWPSSSASSSARSCRCVAFDQAFEVFHELFFAGGTYTFDPSTDRLVQLFPIQFWEETTLALGVVLVVIAGAFAWWGLGRGADT